MQGIILAAGSGSRLGDLTKDIPKVLLSVDGKPLIAYAIAFLRAVGISDIIVVGGPQFEQLEKYVSSLQDKHIQVVHNPNHERESLSSLEAALPFVSDSFLQIDVDFIYTWDIAARVQEQLMGEGIKVICTSSDPPSDMVKVHADDKMRVLDMEKDLTDFEYGYVGMFYCSKSFTPILKQETERIMAHAGLSGAKLWKALTEIAHTTEQVRVGNIGSFPAVEVDTPEEKEEAEEFIKRNQNSVNRYFVV